jgi:hypothetical protein
MSSRKLLERLRWQGRTAVQQMPSCNTESNCDRDLTNCWIGEGNAMLWRNSKILWKAGRA